MIWGSYVVRLHAVKMMHRSLQSVWPEKIAKVYKSCSKLISQEKRIILTPLQILHKNVRDLGKLIVAKGFKKLPKVQKIAQSGHTDA